MRRTIRRTLRGTPVLPKTQWNHSVLFGTRFTTLWRSEIPSSLKVDANALNQRRRRFFSGVQYLVSVKETEGIMLGSTHASTTYGM
jgi:hypothetical protein